MQGEHRSTARLSTGCIGSREHENRAQRGRCGDISERQRDGPCKGTEDIKNIPGSAIYQARGVSVGVGVGWVESPLEGQQRCDRLTLHAVRWGPSGQRAEDVSEDFGRAECPSGDGDGHTSCTGEDE